jgi:hypothetical protein
MNFFPVGLLSEDFVDGTMKRRKMRAMLCNKKTDALHANKFLLEDKSNE